MMNKAIIILINFIFIYNNNLKFIFQISSNYIQTNNNKNFSSISIETLYLQGYLNKIKFINFLNKTYNPEELLFYSTEENIPFTLAFIQGMFPIGEGPILNENQNLISFPPFKNEYYKNEIKNFNPLKYKNNPIPIHVLLKEEFDYNLYKTCNGLKNKIENKLYSRDFLNFRKKIEKKYKKFFELIYNIKVNFIDNIIILENIFNNILDDYYNNKDLSYFQKNNINTNELLNDINIFINFIKRIDNKNDYDLIVYSMSQLFSNILDIFENKINNINNKLKYNLLFMDNNFIQIFLNFMKLVFDLDINYENLNNNIIFELYENKNKEYNIIFYLNDNKKIDINYLTFQNKIKKVIKNKEEIIIMCYNDGEYFNLKIIKNIVLTIILIIMINIYICLKKLNIKKYNHIENKNELKEDLVNNSI